MSDRPVLETPAASFTSYQKFVVTVFAFMQFTIILDFMIMSPLGATIMPALQISPSQFSVAVSVYAFAAGISALIAASFADKFDRKKLLLIFYVGFLIGTLFCGLAPTYELFLAARLVTGMSGGVIGAIGFAIMAISVVALILVYRIHLMISDKIKN